MTSILRWFSRYVSRTFREDVKPWMADQWYSISRGQCLGKSKKNSDDENLYDYVNIPIGNWTTQDTISFIRCEVTLGDPREARICRLCEEREVDGGNIANCTDEELMDLGFDQIFKRKLRVKLQSFGRQDEGEDSVQVLRAFLVQAGLGGYRERITEELCVCEIRELSRLLADDDWGAANSESSRWFLRRGARQVASVGMTWEEEQRLREHVRQHLAENQESERARLEALGLLRKGGRKSRRLKGVNEAEQLTESRSRHNDLRRAAAAATVSRSREVGEGKGDWSREINWKQMRDQSRRMEGAMKEAAVKQAREDFLATAYNRRLKEPHRDTYVPDKARATGPVFSR